MVILLERCVEYKFDSSYPMGLNGVINPMEFEKSIGNINRAISLRKYLTLYGLISMILLFGAIALLIVARTAIDRSNHEYLSSVLFGIGWGLFGLFAGCISLGYYLIESRIITRMRQAIARESINYSTRSFTPCSWRLVIPRDRCCQCCRRDVHSHPYVSQDDQDI